MKLETKYYGVVDIEEKSILNFNEGIPGFEDYKKYVLLGEDQDETVFKWLQSVEKPDLAFVIINPFYIKKDYEFDLEESAIQALEIEKPEDVKVYTIVVVPEDVSRISVNLRAPIIINQKNNKGMQVILDREDYSVRHYILELLQCQKQ
ncbi:MAG TPA: flagellar assembly protein FliW [Clostridiaceae bacterium]|nr:flagellar assembly protein FliW [Clostridiaceae bacterium]